MAIQIPQFDNPFDPNNPMQNVYGWIAGLGLDISTDAGRLTLNVNPNFAASSAPPINQINVSLGEVLVLGDSTVDPPIPDVRFSTLDELMSNPAFAQAFSIIAGILYDELIAKHPKLKGATQV